MARTSRGKLRAASAAAHADGIRDTMAQEAALAMQPPIRILLVEDTPLDAELASRALTKAGVVHTMDRVSSGRDFLERLASFVPDLILSDYSMPGFDGADALALARRHAPEIPFIFLSGTIGEENAIESLRNGAVDYILKNNMGRLATAVERALRDSAERKVKQRAEHELQQVQERFALFMQHLPGPAFIKDLDGRLQFVNRAFEKMANRPGKELVGHTNRELWPHSAPIYDANDTWVVEHNHMLQVFQNMRQVEGERCYLVHKFPIPDADGRPAFVGGVAVDFTDRLAAEQKLARLSRIHMVLSGINSTIVRVRDRAELLHEACRIAVEDGGFRLAWIGMLDATSAALQLAAWNGLAADARIDFSSHAGSLDGAGLAARTVREKAPLVIDDIATDHSLAVASPMPNATAAAALPLPVDGVVCGVIVLYAGGTHVFDDDEMKLLTELAGDIAYALDYIEKKERLDYVAYYDPLTELTNRSLFEDRVSQLIKAHADAHQRTALVVLDLERFSLVNDSLGRQAGDVLLKLVGRRLRDAVPGNATVARLGADTFAFSLSDIREHADVARLIGERVTARLSEPFTVNGHNLRVAFKSGVAIFPGDGDDAESLLKNAETALKKSKASGDRYLFYASAMNASVAGVLHLENRLRVAVDERQFVLFYQPKIELATGRIAGVEALIRWNSPDSGMVSPMQFVPVLEETGLIVDVGLWVLRQASLDQQRWIADAGVAPRVSVNVSARQLRRGDFVDSALAAIVDAGGDPAAMDLEITESVIMENIAQYVPKLQAFREAGMGVEIDDFGTGYSSLAYIGRLPLSAVKIDRAFVNAMDEADDKASIISTIISLAHQLKLKVIAEGVETASQRDMLSALRCDIIQGYLISRPVPAKDILAFLARVPGLH
jgi:diguanylate cyclase (GGDEF)-like protein/PAS domain S-box-containing protein